LDDQQLLEAELDASAGASATVSVWLSCRLALSGRVKLISVELLAGRVVLFSPVWAMLIESIKRRDASIIPIKIELFISLSSDHSFYADSFLRN
jgi:hypothetical protein